MPGIAATDAVQPTRLIPVRISPDIWRRVGLVVAPSIAILVTGLVGGTDPLWFRLLFGLSVLVAAVVFFVLRHRPVEVTATLLLWLSVQRFVVAGLTPVSGPTEVRWLLTYKELFFPLIGLALLPLLVRRFREAPRPIQVVDLLAAACGVVVVISLVLSSAPLGDRMVYARRIAFLPFVYVVARLMPWHRTAFRTALLLIVGAGLGLSVFGLLERFLIGDLVWRETIPAAYFYHLTGLAGLNTPGTDFPLDGLPRVYFDFTTGVPQRRLVATFLEATTLAAFLSVTAILALALERPLVVRLAIGAIVGLATVLTLSKAGLAVLGLGVAYVGVTAFIPRFRDPGWLVSMVVGLVGALVVVAVALSVSGASTGALAHFRGLQEGVASAIDAPLGRGLGSGGGFADTLVGSESSFGVLLVQLGWPGLFLWAGWLLSAAVVSASKPVVSRIPGLIAPAIGVALIAFLATASLTESAGGLLGNWIYAFLAGSLFTTAVSAEPEPGRG